MPLLKAHTHRKIYLAILGVYIIGLVFSKPVISMATMGLAVNWLAEGNLVRKFKTAFTHPISLSFILIYLLHIVGLSYSTDLAYALNDVKVKLPLFVLPILFTSHHQIKRNELTRLLQLFVLSVFVSTLISVAVYLKILLPERDVSDVRYISLFMSHIRFGLLICFAIFVLVWLIKQQSVVARTIHFVFIAWFIGILVLLESGNGILVLLVISTLALLVVAFTKTGIKGRITAIVGVLAIPITTFLYLNQCVKEQHHVVQDAVNFELPEFTAQGNPYEHDTTTFILENGYYTWRNICIGEMANAWNERSDIEYGTADNNGILIDGALIRYLTSKGLRKDAVGVNALSDEEVALIENGVTNVHDEDTWGLRKRINQVIFEFDVYLSGGNPSGNSITQRLEFWRAAWHIVKTNPVFGVGTGDVKNEFAYAYNEIDSPLDEAHRLKSHNQFITITVAFGFVGLLIFVVLLAVPLFNIGWRYHRLYLVLYATSIISFLSEDTLEMQVGVTFFTFFSCLFLLGVGKDEPTVQST